MSIKIVQYRFGGPEVLEVVDAPPAPDELAAGQVLIRTAYAGVNPVDVMTRTGGGMAAAGAVSLPFTPGWDRAGTIEAVGDQVTDLRAGDRVFGMVGFPHEGAAYAQHVVAPAADLVITPEVLSDDAAAALPMAGMTAWQAFTDTTQVKPGQRVLITGAGGGVGHLAVQIARHLGATVTAVASPAKHAWLRDLGAERTVDYNNHDALAALADDPADVTLELAGRTIARHALASTRRGGTVIEIAGAADDLRPDAEAAGVRIAATAVHTERSWLQHVADLAAKGALAPLVSHVFDLTDAADAHRLIEAGHMRGKIVLRS
jgi:NADPH:quinone reductase